MNIYDTAHELARQISESDQRKRYDAIRDEVMEDENNKRMVQDFKKMQFEAQAAILAGQEPPADLLDKLQKLGSILQFNPKITEYFAAEYTLQTLMADMYKIIGDACGVEVPMMQE